MGGADSRASPHGTGLTYYFDRLNMRSILMHFWALHVIYGYSVPTWNLPPVFMGGSRLYENLSHV